MKRKLLFALAGILLLTFFGSTGLMLYHYRGYQQAEETAAQAQSLAGMDTVPPQEELPLVSLPDEPVPREGEPDDDFAHWETAPQLPSGQIRHPESLDGDPYAALLAEIDLAALQAVNSDVIGWILIPDTGINYPLLQAPNNERYLGKDWKGEKSLAGAIFMECQNLADLSGFSTIIYGHKMQDGSMFSELHDYHDQDFADAHPYIFLMTAQGVYRYEIFAAYEADVCSTTYRLEFDEEAKAEYIRWGLSQSVLEMGVSPAVTDRILTLSTCTGNGHAARWVVQARLRMVAEKLYEC